MMLVQQIPFFFFFNDTATTEIYTLSLHDALPIFRVAKREKKRRTEAREETNQAGYGRSEEHTSELQSQSNLVCRLLLEKKKKMTHVDVKLTVSHRIEIYVSTKTTNMTPSCTHT